MSLLDEMRAAGIKPANAPQNNTEVASPSTQKTLLQQMQEAGIKPANPPRTSDIKRPPQDGFIKSVVKGFIEPFAKIDTSIYNVGSSVNKLVHGDVQGASEAIGKSRNIPFLGETKPAFTGQETTAGVAKKMAGYGTDIATTILPIGGAGEVIEQGTKGMIKQAVKQGAKYGATTGFGQGAASELEKGDQGSLSEAFKQGVIGAAIGAPVGAATGFVGGKVTNKLKNSAALKEEKVLNDALEVVRPELNKSQRVSALKAGQGEAKGVLKTIDINNPNDLDVAEAVKGVVSSKKPVTENIKTVKDAIKEEALKLRTKLAENNAIFNQSQIQSRLSTHTPTISLKSDTVLNNAYDITKQRLMEIINKNPKNLTGLLDSRIEFDNMVEHELGDIYKNPNSTPLKKAITDLRGIVNNYIAEKAPNMGVLESLNKQSLMYRARDSMAEKGAKEVGSNTVKRFTVKYPTITKLGKYGATLVAGGIGANAIFGK